MRCFVFSEEPSGALYADLIDFCCEIGSQAIVVVQEPSPQADAVLRRIEADHVREESVSEWPGTILLHGGQAAVHWYTVTPKLQELFKQLASRLFEWVGYMPEDPCFFRANGEVLLVTTSHEDDAYLLLNADEQEILENRYSALFGILQYEGELGSPLPSKVTS